ESEQRGRGETQPRKDRTRFSYSPKGFAEWLVDISRLTAPLMDDGRSSKELMDELYDVETGLPKYPVGRSAMERQKNEPEYQKSGDL
ncbi:MAG: hypothetical protein ABR991_05160, partial [Terracidiphilus sp.]